jgi:hypothetical protein
MTRPLITVIHGLPGDPDHINETREMNDVEFAQYQLDAAAEAERTQAAEEAEAAAQAKADAKAALLEKLGLTQDIIDILAN